jgi:hypothetical protein
MAATGVKNLGETVDKILEPSGKPSSRANANITRLADVTVARPQRNCAIKMPAYSVNFRPDGIFASMV